MNIKIFSSAFILLIMFSGCALVTDEYQKNQRKVTQHLAAYHLLKYATRRD